MADRTNASLNGFEFGRRQPLRDPREVNTRDSGWAQAFPTNSNANSHSISRVNLFSPNDRTLDVNAQSSNFNISGSNANARPPDINTRGTTANSWSSNVNIRNSHTNIGTHSINTTNLFTNVRYGQPPALPSSASSQRIFRRQGVQTLPANILNQCRPTTGRRNSPQLDPTYRQMTISAGADLLTYCTIRTQLNQAQVVSLSDVAGSLQEAALLALGEYVDEEGRDVLDATLGKEVADGVREFWGEECIADF
ncbi:hypothetical protein GQ43DRAFT_429582 [Delitschia confertaspora ATCC 74209]|uniref:Uncharacterized protein n=1 Tax=Delitschia confertaspora ATCC 74209 TaxID=1513339 RepID=A0A9P4JV09_9PLEO|nr:hypothetical protein GQ43DRAFT_429582 [Delitschia confertaspora ATCC 74209]